MRNIKTATVLPDDCETVSALASFLNEQEMGFDREIVNFGLVEIPSNMQGTPLESLNRRSRCI
jgi:hypothetical protein